MHFLSKIQTISGVSIILALLVLAAGCKPGTKKEPAEVTQNPECKLEKSFFGFTTEGDSAMLFTMENEQGLVVKITNYGGTITEIHTPDRDGKIENIVLGFDNLDQYLADHPHFGGIIGRYGNRIANASFSIDGESYQLAKNNGNNSLHGGVEGFDRRLWTPEVIGCKERTALKLSYLSPDGEEGFPGNLKVSVTYELLMDKLLIYYEAETDKATPVNLTNHSYFNLAGEGTILDHVMYINASRYTPVNDEQIPTGVLANVEGTPFDFRKPTAIGERIEETGGDPIGYDHNYVLDGYTGDKILAAKVMDPKSGRFVECRTTEPGMQFYTSNFLDGTLASGNRVFVQHGALCMETQHFPDSPNQPDFPSTILQPGEKFTSQTSYRFGVEE